MTNAVYAVIGATGQTGAAAAAALAAQGFAVRALARDAAGADKLRAKGWTAIEGSVDDPASLTRLFEGVAGAYVMNPPAYGSPDPLGDAERVGAAVAAAAEATGLPRFVLLSSVGAQHAAGTGVILTNHRLEQATAGLADRRVALRADYFLENWLAVLPVAREQGVLPSFVAGDHPMAMNAAADIGATAAELLLATETGIVEFGGPADETPDACAAAASAALGRPVALLHPPRAAWAEEIAKWGMSPATTALFVGMYQGIADGVVARPAGAKLRRGPTTAAAWLAARLAA